VRSALKAFAGLEPTAQDALERDLLTLARGHNTSTTGALRVPSDYVEVVAIKAA